MGGDLAATKRVRTIRHHLRSRGGSENARQNASRSEERADQQSSHPLALSILWRRCRTGVLPAATRTGRSSFGPRRGQAIRLCLRAVAWCGRWRYWRKVVLPLGAGKIKLWVYEGTGEPVVLSQNTDSAVLSLAVLRDGRLAAGDNPGVRIRGGQARRFGGGAGTVIRDRGHAVLPQRRADRIACHTR